MQVVFAVNFSMDSSTNKPSSGWEICAVQNALGGALEPLAVDFNNDEDFMLF